jgi:hypothetical protein
MGEPVLGIEPRVAGYKSVGTCVQNGDTPSRQDSKFPSTSVIAAAADVQKCCVVHIFC